jgi:2-polyprenyl-6-methoxyphenol hydroxylase-like FAD-dependent oxidoreductase
MPVGLSEGLKVAVIGAGPAGCAFAGALLAAARALGRQVQLTLYDGQRKGRSVVAPALLDTTTRCRLASLGAVLPTRPAATEVRGVLVHAGGRSALLEPPAGGLWIVDSPELAGERIVKQILLNAATLRGARVRASSVDAVERQGSEWVVRAHGSSESYGLIAGAFGSESSLAARWPEGWLRRPRLLKCSNARTSWTGRDDLLRVCFAPTPQVDALMLVPCGTSAYVLAIGEEVSPSDLAAALAALVRERVLPSGFRILKVDTWRWYPAPRLGWLATPSSPSARRRWAVCSTLACCPRSSRRPAPPMPPSSWASRALCTGGWRAVRGI